MENRITNKVNAFLNIFKTDVITRVEQIMDGEQTNTVKLNILKNFMLDYEPFQLSKQDLQKRKRTKNTVPMFDRCLAKRANGEQCTRRKKSSEEYCGTHNKGTPHGILDINQTDVKKLKKVEVNIIDIGGILYYVDNENNVYNSVDITQNKTNPRIIAKYNPDTKVLNFESVSNELKNE